MLSPRAALNDLRRSVVEKGFKGNLLALLTGTSISQFLALLCMPLLTRLYDPDAFGRFGIFFALIAILGTLSTGRMEMTIPLAKDVTEAKKLWKVCFYLIAALSLASSALLFTAINIYKGDFHGVNNLQFWAAVSIGIFLLALAEPLNQWHNRQKNYRIIALRNIIERVTVIIASVTFAFTPFTMDGLIWAQNVAIAIAVLFFIYKALPEPPYSEPLSQKEFGRLLGHYRDFPLMQGWSAILIKLGTQVPILLWGTRFTIEETGQLNLAYRMVEAPVTLLASSFALTYLQYTSHLSKSDLERAFLRSLKGKAILLVIPFLGLFVVAPTLFQFIFGDDWQLAGEFARPLALLSYIKILYLSQSVILLVLRRLDLEFKLSLAFLLAQLTGLYGAEWLDLNGQSTLVLMSLLSATVFALGLIAILRQIRFKHENHRQFPAVATKEI